MIRGTTPTHTFRTSISLVDAVKVVVTYKQGKIILEKNKEDCIITPETLTVELTQEETFDFKTYGYKAEVQITAEFMQGEKPKVFKSNISPVNVAKTLREKVI